MNGKSPSRLRNLPGKLMNKKFIHCALSKADKKLLLSSIKDRIQKLNSDDVAAYSVQEDWELKERTSKYICNSSHAFTFFDLPCYFPLADKGLMGHFQKQSLKLRKYGKLYKETVYHYYFRYYALDFEDDIQSSKLAVMINNFKKVLRPFLPMRIKNSLLLKNDWANYDTMTTILLNELHEAGIYPTNPGSSHLYRILEWYLWKVSRE
jgi:hypothetical protein